MNELQRIALPIQVIVHALQDHGTAVAVGAGLEFRRMCHPEGADNPRVQRTIRMERPRVPQKAKRR